MSSTTPPVKDETLYDKSKVDFTSSSSGEYKFYPDQPNSLEHMVNFSAKEPSKFYDPCAESSRMSVRCLEINGRENKAVCNEYFEAYRECKKAWLAHRRKERLEGRGW